MASGRYTTNVIIHFMDTLLDTNGVPAIFGRAPRSVFLCTRVYILYENIDGSYYSSANIDSLIAV